MRNQTELEFIKRFIDNTYSRFGNMLMVNTEKPFNPDNFYKVIANQLA